MRRQTKGRPVLLHAFFAAEVALLFYILVSIATYTTFVSTEDGYVMRALGGCFTDRPMVWVPYISPLLARFVALLYGWFPALNCYTMLERLLIITGMTTVNVCAFRQLRRAAPDLEYIPGIVASALIDSALCWVAVRMHMNSVAAVACAAALCILLTVDYQGRWFPLHALAVLVFYFFSLGFAPEMGPGMLCFLLLALTYRAIAPSKRGRSNQKGIIRGIALFLVLVVAFVGSAMLYERERTNKSGPDYAEWEAERWAYANTAVASYDENAQLYDSVGWSRDYCDLANRSFNMDEQFNAQSIRSILERSAETRAEALDRILTSMRQGEGAGGSLRVVLGLSVAIVGLLLCLIILSLRARRPLWRLLTIIGSLVCCAVMCLVRLSRGAFGLPDFALGALPCVAFLFMLLLDQVREACGSRRDDRRERAHRGKRARRVLACAVVAIVCFGLCAVNAVGYLQNADNRDYYARALEKEKVLHEYAASHTSNLLIYDSDALPGFGMTRAHGAGELSNLIQWGGHGYNSYSSREQLRLNGLESPLTSQVFGKRRARFITDSKESIRLLLRYLSAEQGLNACVITDELQEGLYVAQFVSAYKHKSKDPLPVRVLACKDGQISDITPEKTQPTGLPGAEIKAYYHYTEGMQAGVVTSTVQSGVPTPLKTVEAVGFQSEDGTFSGWKAYRTDKKCWRVVTGNGVAYWGSAVPEGGDYYYYADGELLELKAGPDTELHLYAQWDRCCTICYHSSEYAPPSKVTTRAILTQPTRVLSYEELGFSAPGRVFIGWKLFREDEHKWFCVNAKGEPVWKNEEDMDFRLIANESTISGFYRPNSRIHLYAQWKWADVFTVRYHHDDEAPAYATTTQVTRGKNTATLTHEDLKLFEEGQRFIGWKVYRSDTQCWRVVDGKGKRSWAKTLPEGGDYWIAEEGWTISKIIPSGYDLHLYAQWENTDKYTIYYHIFDGAEADPRVTKVALGERKKKTLTIEKLGYSVPGCHFKGWKLYSPINGYWRVVNEEGERRWASAPASDETYRLFADGFRTFGGIRAGYELHLYAVWERDE